MSVFSHPALGAKEDADRYIQAVLRLVEGRDEWAVLRSTGRGLRKAVEDMSEQPLRLAGARIREAVLERRA